MRQNIVLWQATEALPILLGKLRWALITDAILRRKPCVTLFPVLVVPAIFPKKLMFSDPSATVTKKKLDSK
jgi:hypothetical protein